MIDTTIEQLVSFDDAADYLPSNPHRATVWRWSQRGVRGVRLESVLVGGKRFTSREAIDRFLAASNDEQKRPGLQPGPNVNEPAVMEGRHTDGF